MAASIDAAGGLHGRCPGHTQQQRDHAAPGGPGQRAGDGADPGLRCDIGFSMRGCMASCGRQIDGEIGQRRNAARFGDVERTDTAAAAIAEMWRTHSECKRAKPFVCQLAVPGEPANKHFRSAASSTRSNSRLARLSRLCVRHGLACSAFSVVNGLPSAPSACGLQVLCGASLAPPPLRIAALRSGSAQAKEAAHWVWE